MKLPEKKDLERISKRAQLTENECGESSIQLDDINWLLGATYEALRLQQHVQEILQTLDQQTHILAALILQKGGKVEIDDMYRGLVSPLTVIELAADPSRKLTHVRVFTREPDNDA